MHLLVVTFVSPGEVKCSNYHTNEDRNNANSNNLTEAKCCRGHVGHFAVMLTDEVHMRKSSGLVRCAGGAGGVK